MVSYKCSYQVTTWWENKKGRPVPKDTSNIDKKVYVKDHKAISTKIKEMNHKEFNKGLSFFIDPMGRQEDEFKHIVTQAKDCERQMNPTKLT